MRLIRVRALALLLVGVAFPSDQALAQSATVPEPTELTRRRLSARRVTGPITLDGRLDEPDWLSAPVASQFQQARPDFAPVAPHQSQVRVLFDNDHLYVGAFNQDSTGVSSLRLPDLRRDFDAPESDVFGVTIGSLGDRRTSFQFQVTPLGSQADVQAFDGGDQFNFNWDAMWRVRTMRADSGWTVEMAIPWTSLRYSRGLTSWDVNFVRNTRRALQWSAWQAFPRQFSSWRLTYSGALDSVLPPPPRANIRVRPYVLATTQRDLAQRASRSLIGDVGGEVIWSPTANSVIEGTVNTDFAQADVDRQVVNLTRFSVFFPERRQFFLENADLLSGGGLSIGRYIVQPFFSRTIGLSSDGSPRTLDGGARYAYRSGRATAGALVMHQRAEGGAPASTFAVVRGSRYAGRATRLGGTIALRDDGDPGARNVVTSIDGLMRFGELIQASGTVSTSSDGGRTGVAATYFVGRETPRLYTGVLGALVTRDYNPRTGFVSRPNVLLTSPAVSLTLQPEGRPDWLVWMRPRIITYFFQDPSNRRLQEGYVANDFEWLFSSGAAIRPYVERHLQRPVEPVPLLPTVTIAPGTHDYWRYGLDLKSDQSAVWSATANVSTGTFFDGALDQVVVGGRWSPRHHVALRASYEVNRLQELGPDAATLVAHLAGPEVRVFLNPRVQWSAFYQYNTLQERGTLNARFSWEFAPLSFLYVVYNDRQAVSGGTLPRANSLIVKLSWLRQL